MRPPIRSPFVHPLFRQARRLTLVAVCSVRSWLARSGAVTVRSHGHRLPAKKAKGRERPRPVHLELGPMEERFYMGPAIGGILAWA
jgi:hypothetical protein